MEEVEGKVNPIRGWEGRISSSREKRKWPLYMSMLLMGKMECMAEEFSQKIKPCFVLTYLAKSSLAYELMYITYG